MFSNPIYGEDGVNGCLKPPTGDHSPEMAGFIEFRNRPIFDYLPFK